MDNNKNDKQLPTTTMERLYEPLTDSQRERLASSVEFFQYERGETIFSIGDEARHLVYLLNGRVTLYGRGIGDRMHVVRLVRPNGIFGYQAHFADEPQNTTAVANEQLCVARIPMSVVRQLASENGNFAMLFINDLSVMLGISARRTISMTQKHLRGRLAETLLAVRRGYGVETDGQTLAIYISREDLASTANMTTSNAIRTLSAFAQEGLIAIEGRRIVILNPDALQRISDLG